MNTEQFNKILKARLEKIESVLSKKAEEYADGDEDRLHNFNVGAAFTGKPREKVLWGMALKHIISIQDMIEDIEKGQIPNYAIVNEKLGDFINYGVLLEACFVQTIKDYQEKNKEK